MTNRALWVISLLFATALAAAYDDYASARQKLDQIESGRLRAGTLVELSPTELNAYITREAPDGVRRREARSSPFPLTRARTWVHDEADPAPPLPQVRP